MDQVELKAIRETSDPEAETASLVSPGTLDRPDHPDPLGWEGTLLLKCQVDLMRRPAVLRWE